MHISSGEPAGHRRREYYNQIFEIYDIQALPMINTQALNGSEIPNYNLESCEASGMMECMDEGKTNSVI